MLQVCNKVRSCSQIAVLRSCSWIDIKTVKHFDDINFLDVFNRRGNFKYPNVFGNEYCIQSRERLTTPPLKLWAKPKPCNHNQYPLNQGQKLPIIISWRLERASENEVAGRDRHLESEFVLICFKTVFLGGYRNASSKRAITKAQEMEISFVFV